MQRFHISAGIVLSYKNYSCTLLCVYLIENYCWIKYNVNKKKDPGHFNLGRGSESLHNKVLPESRLQLFANFSHEAVAKRHHQVCGFSRADSHLPLLTSSEL